MFTKKKNKRDDTGGKAKPGKIVSFDFVTLRTIEMRMTSEYEIVMKNGVAETSFYRITFDRDEDRRVLQARAECCEDEALKLLNECELLSWDGFVGPHPMGVLDGTMFTLKAEVNGGKKIYAHGSQNFPKHYREFTDRLRAVTVEREGNGDPDLQLK